MADRRYGVALVAVFGLAFGLRLLPLAWSPYPATLDGFGYAALAHETLTAGRLPVGTMRADNVVYTLLLSMTGAVVDVHPLRIAQPGVAVVGAASVLVAVAVVRRYARALGFPPSPVRLAAVAVGLGLAVDGLYLRRTGVPDEEALAFVLLPVLVLALHRWQTTGDRSWLGLGALVLVVFPMTHTFSTLVAGVTLVAWLVSVPSPDRKARLAATAIVAGFWGYFTAYDAGLGRLGLVVPYVGRVTARPGLFLAWLVAMAVGIWWFRGSRRWTQRTAVFGLLVFGVAVVLVNSYAPVFPGTVRSPDRLTGLLAVYLVPGAAAAVGAPRLADDREGAVLLLALLAAPVALVGFSLTADLTPAFFGTVMRAQTFAHLPIVAIASIAGAGLVRSNPRGSIGPVVVGMVLAALVVTAPVAYVDLDTLAFPSTTTESEVRVVTFAVEYIPGQWTSDQVLTRIGVHAGETAGSIGPVASWLAGGPPPGCALLSAASWTTAGAHLFPAGPAVIDPSRYADVLAERNRVYASGDGFDRFAITLPRSTALGC